MNTERRIIPPIIADDGSLYYETAMTPAAPDKQPDICPMVPFRIIPVIFVPGIMGSNLMDSSGNKLWRMDSKPGAGYAWISKGPDARKQLLDPTKTKVDNRGALPRGTALSREVMRERGWGEVAAMSYGDFLAWLETHLNDSHAATGYGRQGLRAELMNKAVADTLDLPPLTHDEVAMSYRYQFPVWAAGYNWLESNAVSAEKYLQKRINQAIDHYKHRGYRCEKVILVTHSMGGLVARYYSEALKQSDNVLGIVHGVMPATGSATAYKRVKAGTEGIAGLVIGSTAAEVTAVFAQSPGALQLLPSSEYGKGWLKIRDHERIVRLPTTDGDPYSEIYLQRGKWWGLINEQLLNPLDHGKKTLDKDWNNYTKIIGKDVMGFHAEISHKYHHNTYAFYGDDSSLKTWGEITWKIEQFSLNVPPIEDLTSGALGWDAGTGWSTVKFMDGRYERHLVLEPPDESGDNTVPRRSGNAPEGKRGVQVCVAFPDCDHEGAYKDKPGPERRRFALWAITKIAYAVRETNLAYC